MSPTDIIQGVFRIVSELQAELENQDFRLFHICGTSSLWIEGEKIDRKIYLAARLKVSPDELIDALDQVNSFDQCQALSSHTGDHWDASILYSWAEQNYFVISGGGMSTQMIEFLTSSQADSFIARHGSINH